MAASHSARTKAFISYSHADKKYLERLSIHLEYYKREWKLDIWSDQRIHPGADWKDEIRVAIASAKVAILLVSADFLASKFIADNELPPLLEAAKRDGLVIFPIILSPCAFEDSRLASYQAINSPSDPLRGMSYSKREATWKKLAKQVAVTLEPAPPFREEPGVSPKIKERRMNEEDEHNDGNRKQTTSDSSPQPSWLKSIQPIKLAQKAEQPDSTPRSQGTILSEYTGHSSYISLVAWSPDGTRIASSDGGFSDSSDGGILHVWNADGSGQLFTYDPHDHSWYVAWSPDGTRIALGHGTYSTVWSADGSGQLFSYKNGGHYSAAWSPDSTRIASICNFILGVQVWNADGSGPLCTLENSSSLFNPRDWYSLLNNSDLPSANTSVAWSPDGTRIASGYGSGTIQVWNADGSGQRFIYKSKKPFSLGNWNRPDPHAVNSLTWSPDSTRIASTSHDDLFVKMWNADSSGLLFAYKGHGNTIGSVAWSPDGTRIASRNSDILQVWNADGSGQLFSYKSTNSVFVGPLAWSPDGARIVSVTSYGTILRVWSVTVPVW
jgi:WD40 repeat protein